MRKLGDLRFTLHGLWNIIKLHKYHAKFSYTETDAELPNINEEISGEGWFTSHGNHGNVSKAHFFIEVYRHFSMHKAPWMGERYKPIPNADIQDGYNHILALKGFEGSRRVLAK